MLCNLSSLLAKWCFFNDDEGFCFEGKRKAAHLKGKKQEQKAFVGQKSMWCAYVFIYGGELFRQFLLFLN